MISLGRKKHRRRKHGLGDDAPAAEEDGRPLGDKLRELQLKFETAESEIYHRVFEKASKEAHRQGSLGEDHCIVCVKSAVLGYPRYNPMECCCYIIARMGDEKIRAALVGPLQVLLYWDDMGKRQRHKKKRSFYAKEARLLMSQHKGNPGGRGKYMICDGARGDHSNRDRYSVPRRMMLDG